MTDSLGAAIYDYSLSFALKLTTCKSCMEVRYNLSRAQPHASSYLTSVDVWRMSRACEAAARQARHTSILVWARENGNNSYANPNSLRFINAALIRIGCYSAARR
jgi:hypothetical protein